MTARGTERVEKFPGKRFDGRLKDFSFQRGYSVLTVSINNVRYHRFASLKGFVCLYIFEEC